MNHDSPQFEPQRKVTATKIRQKIKINQLVKIQLGIGALLVWGALGLSGNLGANSFLIFFAATSTQNISLTWTAPGDDGSTAGTAATAYDIRYATQPISESTWASATQITNEPTPKNAGSLETLVISGLQDNTTYYFAIKSVDNAGNWSGLSNVASVQVPAEDDGGGGTPPPADCTPVWTCTTWSACNNGTKTRTCSDSRNCGTTSGKPATSEQCSCQPSWSCGDWSTCNEDNQQTRTCADANRCTGDVFKPVTIQACGDTIGGTGGDDEPPITPPSGTPPGEFYAGDLVRTDNSSALYYIGTDYKKYVFPDEKTYFSWFENFDQVLWTSITELDKYGDGGAMTYRAGSYMVTTPDTNKVYAVVGRGKLYWIPDEATAASLYGPSWAQRVRDVTPGYFVSTYTQTGETLTRHLNGTLLKYNTSYYVVIANGVVRRFVNDGLNTNNFNPNFAITVSNLNDFTPGDDIDSRETDLFYLR